MPELPEVETIVRQLRQKISRQVIGNVRIFDKGKITLKTSSIVGSKIEDIFRSGKQIVIRLASIHKPKDSYLIIHLRMTGSLIWSAKNFSEKPKYARAMFQTAKGDLYFTDPRRFGIIDYSCDLESFKPLGIEPLSEEFTVRYLSELISNLNQPLKHFLMRQDKIVGIGNIYASEILFNAKLNPKRKTCSLKKEEIIALHRSIKKILAAAIKHNGTTISDYKDTSGKTGGYATALKVYDRENRSCPRCKFPTISRITQQGRSTYFCSQCQG